MERPQVVLIVLVAGGIAISGFIFGAHERSALQKKHQSELESKERDYKSELSKVRDESGDISTPLGPGDLMPEGSGSGGNSVESQLQDQVSYLEEQLSLIRDENARLLKLTDRLETALKSAGAAGGGRIFNAEELAAQEKVEELTEKSRDLEFKTPVEIEFSDWDKMSAALRGRIRPSRTAEQRALLSRAYASMGFVDPTTDVTEEIVSLLTSQLGAALYVGDNKILFNKDGSLLSIHDRTSLAVALTRALQDQHFDLSQAPPPSPNNDDAYTAADALLTGDAAIMKVRHTMFDMAAPGDDLRNSPTALSREDFNAATPFIREYFLFPYTMGQSFCEELHGKGKWKAINAAIARPPATTAEILHPELYLAGDFKPEPFAWSGEQLLVNGTAPLWNNVAGELGISVFLNRAYFKYEMHSQAFYDADLPPLTKRDLREDPGSLAAAGWMGDRYLVYPNGDGAGGSDHTFWRTRWASANDAAEFFHGARVALAYSNNITLAKNEYEIDSDPEKREPITPESVGKTYQITPPNGRHLHIELDEASKEVTVINAANQEWLEALKRL